MRVKRSEQGSMFSYIDVEQRIPGNHPLRKIRKVVDEALRALDPLFDSMCSHTGRPAIEPHMQIRAMVLQITQSIRSERKLMEDINYDIRYRWFVGLSMDEPVWHPTVFTHNRDRLLRHDVAERFLAEITKQAAARKLLSKDHFSLDGTLLEACASIKSFKPKDAPKPPDGGDAGASGNEMRDFRGEKFSNRTHESTTDPDARLYRKGNGQAAKLCHMGHALIENRNGLVVAAAVSEANGTAERETGLKLLKELPKRGRRRTVGCDRNYDERKFVKGCREMRITPHSAAKRKGGAVDGRTTRHEGYRVSMRRRKRVEEPFGWMKNIGLMRKQRHRGRDRVQQMFQFSAAAYNITLMIGLAGAAL